MQHSHTGRSEQEFQDLLRRLELALDASQIGVWEHNLDSDRMVWDAQMHRLYATGQTSGEITADVWTKAIHPDDRERAAAEFDEALAAAAPYNSQYRIIRPDGEVRHMRSRAHFYEGPGGVPAFIGAEWDVTADVLLNRELADQTAVAEARAVAIERSRARIEYAADHDYLTGLPNRRYFDRALSELQADDGIERMAVISIDLDHFKQINDKSGHAGGDVILQAVAAKISSGIGENDILARLGGDEFVVIARNFDGVDGLRQMVESLLCGLREKLWTQQDAVRMSASVGVAWADAGDAGNLLTESGLALFQAKKLGRDRVEFFTPQLQSALQGERQIADELKLAVIGREIVPFYQVQVDAQTREVVGLEALARWNHPVRGVLAPALFMKAAEDGGLTAQIDAMILDCVLEDRTLWARQGIEPPRIAVNISSSRLTDPRLVDSLVELDIPPRAIVFELIETIFLDDCDDRVLANVDRIKRMGIDIEIDDFGSGHASLIGLVKLKPKRLKIDRQLVTAITSSQEERRIVGSILEIARALDVEVIAEGVETEEHARLLATMGCDTMQGYLFGRPCSATDTFQRLAAAATADKNGVRGSAAQRSMCS